MRKYFENLARALFGAEFHTLSEEQRRVIESIANEAPIAENPNEIFEDELGLGQRIADRVSGFVGSWGFILLFVALMTAWVVYNSFLLLAPENIFDPYPYILLNLGLSTLAAVQAPFIMMSQNRQAEKDKIKVDANYEVSLKTDLEITRLHQKIDALVEQLADRQNGDR